LYKEKFTISGARKKLQEVYGNPEPLIDQLAIPFADPQARHVITTIRNELLELRQILSGGSSRKKKVDSA
jgi:hypothetical protein